MKTRVLRAAFALAFVLSVELASAAEKPAKTPATPAKGAAKPPAKAEPKLSAAEIEKRIDAAFPEFLKDPNKANFLKVQSLVVSLPSYSPYSSDLDEALDLLGEKKFKQVKEQLEAAKYNLLLSPRAHQFLAQADEGLGDGAAAKRQAEIAEKCIAGIRATGDGTAEKPLTVTRVSDEYDVARSMKKRVAGQGLRIKDGRYYDVLQCADKSELWFDVTTPFATMAKKIKPPAPKKTNKDK